MIQFQTANAQKGETKITITNNASVLLTDKGRVNLNYDQTMVSLDVKSLESFFKCLIIQNKFSNGFIKINA